MHEAFIEVLKCPICNSHLTLSSSTKKIGTIIVRGTLKCPTCGRSYNIISGIPYLSVLDQTEEIIAERYGLLFTYWLNNYFGNKLYGLIAEEELTEFLNSLGIKEEYLNGLWILDVGCGVARLDAMLALKGAYVVGTDIHTALPLVYYYIVRSVPKVMREGKLLIVNQDIHHLTFNKEFDIVWCEGVLSYVRDPYKAVINLVKLVKDGGMLYIWAYGRTPYQVSSTKVKLSKLLRRGRLISKSTSPTRIFKLASIIAVPYALTNIVRLEKVGYRELIFHLYDILIQEYITFLDISKLTRIILRNGLEVRYIKVHDSSFSLLAIKR